MAMATAWAGWPLERIVLLLLGLMFLAIFLQVTLFHYRQNFRHWSMWLPVVATPLDGLLLLWLAFSKPNWLHATTAALLVISLIAGLFGSFMHARGVGERVGGYVMRNFLVGPPVLLPTMITASSLLGLIVLFWSWPR